MASSAETTAPGGHGEGETRRDFLYLATAAFGAFGVGAAIWPLISQMNPAKDALAASTTEVNLAPIAVGQRITVTWRGKPIFIDHRPKKEIEEAQNVKLSELIDPEPDSARVKKGKEQWLVVIGICTHLGCIPLGQKQGQPRGEFHGWFCPCHGSQYDTAARIRKGPAPKNLYLPPYKFLTDTSILIG